MKIIDVVVLLVCLFIVCAVTYQSRKKARYKKAHGTSCGGSCGGCSGCSGIKEFLKERESSK